MQYYKISKFLSNTSKYNSSLTTTVETCQKPWILSHLSGFFDVLKGVNACTYNLDTHTLHTCGQYQSTFR